MCTRQRAATTPARVLVNDRLDIALAAGAHGVHLKSDGMAPSVVRSLLRDARIREAEFLVGVSAHGGEELAALSADSAVDYVCIGPLADSPGKQALGPEGFAHELALARTIAGGAVRVPWLALGGLR